MRNLCFVMVIAAGCVDEPDLSVETDEVVVANAIVQRGTQCSIYDLSDANLDRFRNGLLYDLLPRARTVANSPAFRSCLRQAMTTGIALPNGTFGPLINAVDEAGQRATAGLPIERVRDIYASRIAVESVSPHQLIVNCTTLPNFEAWADGPPQNGDFAAREEINIRPGLMSLDPSMFPGNTNTRGYLAGLIWHEVMHERNYWHADATYNQHVNPIVGACMQAAFTRSEINCSLTACPGGYNALLSLTGDSGSCGCVRDPGASFQPTFVGGWTLKGLIDAGIDASGQAYAHLSTFSGRAVYKLAGSSWTYLADADVMTVGGDAVAVRQPSPIVNAPPRWWTIPHVGAWTATSSVLGESVRLDGFGRLVRLANGVVERKSGSSAWVQHGPATAFATGSDKLFKISGGVAYRLDDTATPTWVSLGAVDGTIAADFYGTVTNLASNQTLWRHRGTYWEGLGGPATQIGGDASLLIRTPDGYVWRRAPDGGWYAVALCDSFSAGGRSVLCRRGARLELYEY